MQVFRARQILTEKKPEKPRPGKTIGRVFGKARVFPGRGLWKWMSRWAAVIFGVIGP
jgi:hypothetical protein